MSALLGQVVRLTEAKVIKVNPRFKRAISQYGQCFSTAIRQEERSYTVRGNQTMKWTETFCAVTIPAETVGIIIRVHKWQWRGGYVYDVGIPNPVTKKITGYFKCRALTGEFTDQVTIEDKRALDKCRRTFIARSIKDNLAAIEQIELTK